MTGRRRGADAQRRLPEDSQLLNREGAWDRSTALGEPRDVERPPQVHAVMLDERGACVARPRLRGLPPSPADLTAPPEESMVTVQ
jgi:hypothetical protein